MHPEGGWIDLIQHLIRITPMQACVLWPHCAFSICMHTHSLHGRQCQMLCMCFSIYLREPEDEHCDVCTAAALQGGVCIP